MSEPLITPILIKQEEGEVSWPEGVAAFYLLSRDGLFMCRDHEFFRSCVRAPGFPRELAGQEPFLEAGYPPIPQGELERLVGFFARIGSEHGAEAGAHLVWDRDTREVSVLVPEQIATVSRSWGGYRSAIGLEYSVPTDLPAHQFIFGDVHSHVESAAYASGTDVHDEMHRPGLHVVVGRISKEPPELHAEIVVDRTRFSIDPTAVIEGYEKRSTDVPDEWIERVAIEERTWTSSWSKGGWGQGSWSQGDGAARGGWRAREEAPDPGDDWDDRWGGAR